MLGFQGRLNPIRDAHGRTHLYASGIAINYSAKISVQTFLSEEMPVTDAEGMDHVIRGIIHCRQVTVTDRRLYL